METGQSLLNHHIKSFLLEKMIMDKNQFKAIKHEP